MLVKDGYCIIVAGVKVCVKDGSTEILHGGGDGSWC